MDWNDCWRRDKNMDYGNSYLESGNIIKSAEEKMRMKVALDDAVKSSEGTVCRNDSVANADLAVDSSRYETGPCHDFPETAMQQGAAEPKADSFAIVGDGNYVDQAAGMADTQRRALLSQLYMKHEWQEKASRRNANIMAWKEVLCLQLMTKKIKTLKTCETLARQIRFTREDEDNAAGADTSNPASASNTVVTSAGNLMLTKCCRKRCHESDHGPASELEDYDSQNPISISGNQQPFDSRLKLACPFRKQDPLKYNLHSYPICALSSWSTIARIKEHLNRVHKAPIFCERCKLRFKTAQALKSHLTVPDRDFCRLKDGPIHEGIRPELAVKLKSRKKSSPGQSESERWRDIFRLLFPDKPVPRPYFEAVLDSATRPSDNPEDLGFEVFSRRELPRTFKESLERSLNDKLKSLDDHSKNELVQMVEKCQRQLASNYQFNQGNIAPRPSPGRVKERLPEPKYRLSEIQKGGPSRDKDMESPEVEKPKEDMSQIDTSTHQQSAISPPLNQESSMAFPSPQNCFCIGQCTCILQSGLQAVMPSPFEDIGLSTMHYEPDWSYDTFDPSWMDSFLSPNASTFLNS